VGPNTIGYGAITAAGQVMRKPVPGDRLVLQAQGQLDMARTHEQLDRAQPRRERNLDYIAQVVALRVWYRTVRLAMVPSSDALERALVEAAIDTLTACIDERVERLGAFLKERGDMPAELDLEPAISCPLHITQRAAGTTHLDWVCNLAVNDVANGRAWLQQIVAAVDPNGTS
jgi:hypothetical protein